MQFLRNEFAKFLRTVYDDAINRDDSDLKSNEEVKI